MKRVFAAFAAAAAALLSAGLAPAATPEGFVPMTRMAPAAVERLDGPEMSAARGGAKPHALESERPVRLGVPFSVFPTSEALLLTGTAIWLRREFGDQLEVVPYAGDALVRAAESGEIDLFIASAGLVRELAPRGAKDLATLSDKWKPNPNAGAAAAVVVRDDSKVSDLGELQGRRMAAAYGDFQSGWQPFVYELKRRGINADRFLGPRRFTGMPMSQIADLVISGEADAGVMSACYLEYLVRTGYPGAERLRVLEERTDDLACRHSTADYPGLTIATMPSANPATMRAVTRELFSMPPIGDDRAHWSVATDFSGTDELLRGLAVGPYRRLQAWTIRRFVDEYRLAIIVTLLLVGFGTVHMVRTEQVVRRRTAQLREAMEEQHRLQAEARERGAQIELLEREGVVQQLSSMLAHELRQPMTAIGLFSKGLISRIRRNECSPEACLEVLGKIRDLNQQSNAIVDHVRSYARADVRRSPIDASEAVAASVRNLMASRFTERDVAVHTEIEPGIVLLADRLEIRLVVTNLLKNAIQACEAEAAPEVIVSFRRIDPGPEGLEGAVIRVADNGPKLTDEEIAKIGRPFRTTKKDGLGLGTSIVRRIAESYGGLVRYSANVPQGVAVEVVLRNPLQMPGANGLQSKDNTKSNTEGDNR